MSYYYMIATALVVTLIVVSAIMVSNYLYSKHSVKRAQKKLASIKSASPYHCQQKSYSKSPDGQLLLDKKQEKEQAKGYELLQQEGVVMKYDPASREVEGREEVKIIGVAEPKGFWSRFIASQKLGYIMAHMGLQQSQSDKGFWVNLIKAQSASRGKNQGKGR